MNDAKGAPRGWAPIAALLGAAALGASSGLYIKGLGFSSFAMSGFRMSIPLLIVAPIAARHGKLLGVPGRRKALLFASVLNAVRLLLYVLAFKFTAMGNGIVLLYTWPVFALIVDNARQKKAPDPARLGVLLLASSGVVVMNVHRDFSWGGRDLIGSVCMILSAFMYAVSTIIFKDSLKEADEFDLLYFQNAVGGLVFLPFMLAGIPSAPIGHTALALVYGAGVGALGFGLFFYAMKRMPLFRYSAISYTEILFGLALGVFFLGESVSVNQIFGVAAILAGSYIAQRLRMTEAER